MLHANPLTFFARGALTMTVLSAALTGWFVFGYQSGGLHLPALLAALLTFVLAVGLFVSGLIADGITTSHRLLEEVLYHSRRVEYDRRFTELPFEASDRWRSSGRRRPGRARRRRRMTVLRKTPTAPSTRSPPASRSSTAPWSEGMTSTSPVESSAGDGCIRHCFIVGRARIPRARALRFRRSPSCSIGTTRGRGAGPSSA